MNMRGAADRWHPAVTAAPAVPLLLVRRSVVLKILFLEYSSYVLAFYYNFSSGANAILSFLVPLPLK